MKTIQTITHRQFKAKTFFIGDQVIEFSAIILVFAVLLFSFLLLITRLG
jgi:hypothetical protein